MKLQASRKKQRMDSRLISAVCFSSFSWKSSLHTNFLPLKVSGLVLVQLTFQSEERLLEEAGARLCIIILHPLVIIFCFTVKNDWIMWRTT